MFFRATKVGKVERAGCYDAVPSVVEGKRRMSDPGQFAAQILETSAPGFAGLVAGLLFERHPEVAVRDDAALAARLLRSLTPEQQKVIRLAVHEGHTHQGIADALELPLGTVKTHLRRGLLKIRDTMKTARPKRRPPPQPKPN